jgi:hypothetical protein
MPSVVSRLAGFAVGTSFSSFSMLPVELGWRFHLPASGAELQGRVSEVEDHLFGHLNKAS